MPSDRVMLERARHLLRRVQALPQGVPTDLRSDCRKWLDDHEKQPATRWRPIDSAGNVAADPAPEPPDYDEGETGPPEVVS